MAQSTLSADSGILKQCTRNQFYKQIQSVTAACALSADRHAKLLSLFRPTRVDAITVFDRDDCGFADEVPFTLWAFPPSDKAWFAVLTLLRKTLRPRVYCSAETRTGQKDVFMLVQTAALNLNKHGFEAWIEDFVETIGMSAGCVCFEEYFGESMLSSLHASSLADMFTATSGTRAARASPYQREFSCAARISETSHCCCRNSQRSVTNE